MSQFLNWLPPSLQPPVSKPRISQLTITTDDLAYLHVLSTKPVFIRFKWWGLKSKQMQYSLMQHTYHFPISVSTQMFLRYCIDMKILEFQLCDFANVCIVKGYINFLLYKHWQGQQIQIVSDLKNVKNGAKIGQIKVILQITQKQNPFLKQQQIRQQMNINRNSNQNQRNIIEKRIYQQQSNKIQDKNTVKNINKKRLSLNEQNNRNINNHQHDQIDRYDRFNRFENELQQNNFINYTINQEQYQFHRQTILNSPKAHNKQRIVIKSRKNQINQFDDTKTRLYKKLSLPLPDDCICDDIRISNLNRQKIQLKQQIDMLFNQNTIYSTNDTIKIQLIGWQSLSKSDQNLPCKISLPVLDKQSRVYRNQYYFGTGKGYIKIGIDSKNNDKQILKQYLSNNNVDLIVGDSYVGKVPLFRIVGSKGDIVSVGVYENKNKREILKGHCMMKLVPQKQVEHSVQKQKQKQKDINKQQINKKQTPKNIEQQKIIQNGNNYIWLYLRQINFLQPKYYKDSNIYISTKLQSQLYKSKTVWRSDCPTFNQILTIKLANNKQIVFQIWNKQATQRLVGKAYLDTTQKMEYNMDVPIEDSYGRVVGYVGLCMGRGDIAAATQFINTHAHAFYNRSHGQSRDPSRYDPNTHRDKQSEQQFHEREHQNSNEQHQHTQQDYISDHNSSPQISPKQQQQSIPSLPLPLPLPPKHIQKQQDLSPLQLHNKIFAKYIHQQYDWFTTYTNRQPSIAELSHLLKPICPQNNIIKFISVYLNLHTQNNSINLDDIKQSYQAFEVYYQILANQRDQVLRKMLESIGEEGISINQLEDAVRQKMKKSKKVDDMWRAVKEHADDIVVENFRYFYEGKNIEQLCDILRKFQVYQTTKGQQIPTQLLSAQVLRQISDLLDIDPHSNALKSSINQAGLQLTKYQLLALFGQIPKKHQPTSSRAKQQSQMIKSPTFGFLGTQRLMQQQQQPKNNLVIQNPSIDARTFENKSGFSGISGLQQKFGHPNLSPINQNNNKTQLVKLKFNNFEHAIETIVINDQQFHLQGVYPDQTVELETNKKFNYEGYIITTDDIKIEFDGPPGEWIGLMGQMGEYCGGVAFQ